MDPRLIGNKSISSTTSTVSETKLKTKQQDATFHLNLVVQKMWKKPLGTHLAKISRTTSFQDLGPISVLPCMSKLLEKIIARRLRADLDCNSILSEIQSGFKTNHSTARALLNLWDNVSHSIGNRKITNLVSLDYKLK